MFNLFRKKPALTNVPNSDCYLYIKGKAYIRRGYLIMCCDFTQPSHEWYPICRLGCGDDNSDVMHIIFAIGLIEGAINVQQVQAFSGQSLN